jgi:hypothetical protein
VKSVMGNPNIAEAGRATQFRKGNVPISPGRPKKTPMSEAYVKHLGERLPEEVRTKLGLPKAATGRMPSPSARSGPRSRGRRMQRARSQTGWKAGHGRPWRSVGRMASRSM